MSEPLLGHVHAPVAKAWPNLTTDWLKIARRPTRGLRIACLVPTTRQTVASSHHRAQTLADRHGPRCFYCGFVALCGATIRLPTHGYWGFSDDDGFRNGLSGVGASDRLPSEHRRSDNRQQHASHSASAGSRGHVHRDDERRRRGVWPHYACWAGGPPSTKASK
jgi:hypothetical protein